MRSRAPRAAIAVFALSVCSSLLCILCRAADEPLVTATSLISKDKIRPGDLFKVAVRLSIAPGYHINGNKIADIFLIPTELSFEKQPGLQVEECLYPVPRSARFSYSESELLVYEGDIIIAALIQPGKDLPLGSQKLRGKLIYQACNNVTCLPPSEFQIEIGLDVVPFSHETKEINQNIFSGLEFKKDKERSKESP